MRKEIEKVRKVPKNSGFPACYFDVSLVRYSLYELKRD